MMIIVVSIYIGYTSSSSDTMEKKHHYEEEPYYSSAYFTTSLRVSPPAFLVYSEVTEPSRIAGYYQELNSTDYASVYATIIRSESERPPSPQETIYSVPQ